MVMAGEGGTSTRKIDGNNDDVPDLALEIPFSFPFLLIFFLFSATPDFNGQNVISIFIITIDGIFAFEKPTQ